MLFCFGTLSDQTHLFLHGYDRSIPKQITKIFPLSSFYLITTKVTSSITPPELKQTDVPLQIEILSLNLIIVFINLLTDEKI